MAVEAVRVSRVEVPRTALENNRRAARVDVGAGCARIQGLGFRGLHELCCPGSLECSRTSLSRYEHAATLETCKLHSFGGKVQLNALPLL